MCDADEMALINFLDRQKKSFRIVATKTTSEGKKCSEKRLPIVAKQRLLTKKGERGNNERENS